MSCYFITGISDALSKAIEELGTWRKETWRLAARTAFEQDAFRLVETGCYRGGGGDGSSTLILAQLAKDQGGILDSYELDLNNIRMAGEALKARGLQNFVRFHPGDSVQSLAAREAPIDFAYLDSFDCGTGPDFSPCQKHQLAEVEAILPLMSRRSAILLDDHIAGGKGKTDLSTQRLDRREWQCVANEYQVLYRTENSHRLIPHRFAVLSGHMKDYAPLAVRTLYHNRAQYCLLHGYDLRLYRKLPPQYARGFNDGTGYSWGRICELLRLLASGVYDWVWVVGADTLVTNLGVTLESFVVEASTPEAEAAPFPQPPKNPQPPLPPGIIRWIVPPWHVWTGKKHLIYAGEAVAPVQADSYLVRASQEGINFVADILAQYPQYKNHIWSENQAMIDLREKYAAITHIVPQHRLNAFDYSLFYNDGEVYRRGQDCFGNRGQWQPGDFLIHWPAQTLQTRLNLLQKFEPQVIYENRPLVSPYPEKSGTEPARIIPVQGGGNAVAGDVQAVPA